MTTTPPEYSSSAVLQELPAPPTRAHFLVFLASHEERGRPWCRDCEAAEPYIRNYIKPLESTTIFVGSREEWNDPSNKWKQAPYNVQRVPTILKVEPGEEAEEPASRVQKAPRIVEAEILDEGRLRSFAA